MNNGNTLLELLQSIKRNANRHRSGSVNQAHDLYIERFKIASKEEKKVALEFLQTTNKHDFLGTGVHLESLITELNDSI